MKGTIKDGICFASILGIIVLIFTGILFVYDSFLEKGEDKCKLFDKENCDYERCRVKQWDNEINRDKLRDCLLDKISSQCMLRDFEEEVKEKVLK